jgi:hypothetical protein
VSESTGCLAPNLHCTSWLKGQETEISTAGRTVKSNAVFFTFTFTPRNGILAILRELRILPILPVFYVF